MAAGALLALLSALVTAPSGGYPRIANLWGCGPAVPDVESWSRYDLLICAGGTAGEWRRFARETRERNPGLILLGTAPLMNISSPEATPWMQPEWYLYRPDGNPVNWWAGQVYAPNLSITECRAALLAQTDEAYGALIDEGVVSGVFYDSVVGGATWYGEVDANRDGVADAPADIDPQWHDYQCAFFDDLRARHPAMAIMANDVDLGHAPHLHGRLFEGGPLLDQVANGSIGPRDAVRRLHEWVTTSLQPAITFAIMTHPLGWQGWRVGKGNAVTTPGEVDRVRRDYARMRLGLLTTLMTDAYFSYDMGTVWYGLPYWYDEYTSALGQPLGDYREVFDVPPVPVLDWSAGRATSGIVLDGAASEGAQGIEVRCADPASGWQRTIGTRPADVRLEPGKRYRIEADCDIIERPTEALQFCVRTAKGGWEHHDKGVQTCPSAAGATWRIEATVVPDEFDDYSIEWHLRGAGAFRLTRLSVHSISESYLMREFDRGIAVLNTTPRPLPVQLPRPMRRLRGDQAPLHVVELDDSSTAFAANGAWELVAGERHYAGLGFRTARKPGDRVTWRFRAPASDHYTVFACVPGGADLSDAAVYSLEGAEGSPSATVDQRSCDGGWLRLFEADLAAGQDYSVVLQSGGAGLTAADAIRLESASRYNDGALVEEEWLAPLDGRILLRED